MLHGLFSKLDILSHENISFQIILIYFFSKSVLFFSNSKNVFFFYFYFLRIDFSSTLILNMILMDQHQIESGQAKIV